MKNQTCILKLEIKLRFGVAYWKQNENINHKFNAGSFDFIMLFMLLNKTDSWNLKFSVKLVLLIEIKIKW